MQKKTRIITILISLIIIILGAGITYSLFTSRANLSGNQGIAKFIFNAKELSSIELPLLDLVPGDHKEYLFSVSNNEDSVVSEVTIEYQIIIKTYHFIPLEISLYKIENEEEIFISECDENYTRNDDNILICNVPTQEMVLSNVRFDDYKLIVEFPSEFNDLIYTELVDFIDLEIKSWQKV